MNRSHLVIGDAHAQPDVSNERFEWLGELIMDRQPPVIVCIGDFYDMPSLSSYDKGKGSMEGRRYKKDIEAGNEALAKLMAPLVKYNKQRSKNKKKQYTPRMIATLGNHENRIGIALNNDPWTLSDVIGYGDFNFIKYGWEVYPYLTRVSVDGIVYTHCVQHKNASQIIGGMNHAQTLLNKLHCSVTVGHSHLFDFKSDVDGSGKRINACVAGCYFEHEEDYAHESNKGWWRGIVYKHNVVDGDYELEQIKLPTIKAKYS